MWPWKPELRVRAILEGSLLPDFSIAGPDFAFISVPGSAWTAVNEPPLSEDWEWGEAVGMSPAEIRLYAALLLSEPNPWEKGQFTLVPGPLFVEAVGADLSLPSVQADVSQRIDTHFSATDLRRAREVNVGVGSASEALRVYDQIDGEDQLLLAGLGRLVQAQRLLVTGWAEDAALPLFIAMGASFEFLRQCLEEQRGSTSMDDVYEYIDNNLPEDSEASEWFKWMYEERIVAVHPANRFGEFWTSPMMTGQVFELRRSLHSLYRHIITDDPLR